MHLGTFDHPYPATKLLWIPDKKGTLPDLIATTGDYLRLWSVGGNHGATLEVMLDNNRSSHYCAPLTAADWNEIEPSLIATSSEYYLVNKHFFNTNLRYRHNLYNLGNRG